MTKRRELGFSLMEVLVVLVLVGLCLSLLLGGGVNFGKIFSNIEGSTQAIDRERLSIHWVRDVVGSSLAVQKKDHTHSFTGAEKEIRGTTLMSIFSEPGKLVRYSLTLVDQGNNQYLSYLEEGKSPINLQFIQDVDSFGYVNSKGVIFREWPPQAELAGLLPKLVVFDRSEELPIFIKINQRRHPVEDLRDLL